MQCLRLNVPFDKRAYAANYTLKMTIIDQEVVGETSSVSDEVPACPLGIFLENSFRQNIAENGDSRWLTDVYTGESMSYIQMVNYMRSVASGLRKRSCFPGDNVVIIGANHIEIPLMSLGAWRAGATLSCLPISLTSDILEMRLSELKTKFILTDQECAIRVVEAVKGLDFVKEVFVIGNKDAPGCSPFDQLLQDAGEECPENLAVDLDSAVWLSYSSGTTGSPKCVVMSHKSTARMFHHFKFLATTKGAKYLFVNQMVITSGIVFSMGLSLAHAHMCFLSDFSEENLMTAIQNVKPVWVSLTPAILAWICRFPDVDQYDLTSVKSVSVLGSKLVPEFEKEIFHRFPNMLFLNNLYGMTEVGVVCQSRPTSTAELEGLDRAEVIAKHIVGSVGRVEPLCKLKVIDVVTGKKLDPNQIGEICLQSPCMLKEYLGNPEETANLIRHGWAHTGDQGYYDEKGNIFVIGRYKDLLKYRNHQVSPINIEKQIMAHPAVEDVAVIGLPDDIDGELPLAFVVLLPGWNTTADEIIAFTNERVMNEEKLRGGVLFLDKIPRNALGKVSRQELKKHFNT